jgi:biopolymer transport protein ExbB
VLEILMAGGWAMLPILICSAVALAIILERFWSLRRSAVIPPGLGDEVREWARSRKIDP